MVDFRVFISPSIYLVLHIIYTPAFIYVNAGVNIYMYILITNTRGKYLIHDDKNFAKNLNRK